MKRFLSVAFLVLVAACPMSVFAGPKADCTRIQDGVLVYDNQNPGHYLDGDPLVIGYDKYGYNYNAHQFNGLYCNAYLGRYGFPPYDGDAEAYLSDYPAAEDVWCWPCRDAHLMMKWSDVWLSNMDCNGNGKLDRGYPCTPGEDDSGDESACEGAWLTNHISGNCPAENLDGFVFVKIVDLPDGANCGSPSDACALYDGNMCVLDGQEIGCQIWGGFAVIQEVHNGEGAVYVSPASPGVGRW